MDFVRAAAQTDNGRRALAAWRRSKTILAYPTGKRRALTRLLERHRDARILVFTADNGQTGVELIERLRPDLAIVDLGLPVMSGFELARHIRRNRKLRGMRLIALSGYGQDADVQAALEAGFDQHLTKPPDPERLERLLAGTDGDVARPGELSRRKAEALRYRNG